MISQRRRVYDAFAHYGPCLCSVVAGHLSLRVEQVRKAAYTMQTQGCLENKTPGTHHAAFGIVEGAKPPDRCYQPATARKRVVVEVPVVDSCLLAECLKQWGSSYTTTPDDDLS